MNALTTLIAATLLFGSKQPQGLPATQLRPLAEAGHVGSQYELGRCYQTGECGVKRDFAAAQEWYAKAAERGDALALNNLGLMHRLGQGVPESDVTALPLLRRGAELGKPMAQFNLACVLDFGEGVAHDQAEAFRWYLLAAEQFDPDAMLAVGDMLCRGVGVPQDRLAGLTWLDVARVIAPDDRLKWKVRGALAEYSRGVAPAQLKEVTARGRAWFEARREVERLEQEAAEANAKRNWAAAAKLLGSALARAERDGLPAAWRSRLLYNLGRTTGLSGDHATGERHLLAALALEKTVTGPDSQISSMRHAELGRLLLDTGRPADALAHLERLIRIADHWGLDVAQPSQLAFALDDQAVALTALGRAEEATAARARAAALRSSPRAEPNAKDLDRYR